MLRPRKRNVFRSGPPRSAVGAARRIECVGGRRVDRVAMLALFWIGFSNAFPAAVSVFGEVTDREARRTRQILEASLANYRSFDNFVCRMRIRQGKPKPTPGGIPVVGRLQNAASMRWVRKGEKQFFEPRPVSFDAVDKTPKMGFVPAGLMLPDVLIRNEKYAMFFEKGIPERDEEAVLRLSETPDRDADDLWHVWNNNGITRGDIGVPAVHLLMLLDHVDVHSAVIDFATVEERGRRMEKITFNPGFEPPARVVVWFDSSRGYLPMRIAVDCLDTKSRSLGTIDEARQFGKSWFPWKTRKWESRQQSVVELDVVELKLGAATESDFELDVPVGTRVERALLQEEDGRFFTEKPMRVSLDDIPRLLAEIDKRRDRMKKERRVARAPGRSRSWVWALIGMGILCVVAGLYLRMRR